MRVRDLSFADWKAIVVRACKRFMANNATTLASALAYSSFFAIPSLLLVAIGLFTLIAGPQAFTSLIQHLHGVIPGRAASLLGGSLQRANAHPGSSLVVTIVGFFLAVWAVTGAMNAYMLAVNIANGRKDRRSFVTKRIVAVKMAAVMGAAFGLVAVLTIFGPVIEHSIASRIGGGRAQPQCLLECASCHRHRSTSALAASRAHRLRRRSPGRPCRRSA